MLRIMSKTNAYHNNKLLMCVTCAQRASPIFGWKSAKRTVSRHINRIVRIKKKLLKINLRNRGRRRLKSVLRPCAMISRLMYVRRVRKYHTAERRKIAFNRTDRIRRRTVNFVNFIVDVLFRRGCYNAAI